VRLALYLQAPQFSGRNSLQEGATQGAAASLERNATSVRDEIGGATQQALPALDEDLAPAQGQANLGGSESNPLRTLFGRFSVRLSVLVAGSLVFCGLLQRATKEPRELAKVRLAKRSASEPPHKR
jgi:hypothetical protein